MKRIRLIHNIKKSHKPIIVSMIKKNFSLLYSAIIKMIIFFFLQKLTFLCILRVYHIQISYQG